MDHNTAVTILATAMEQVIRNYFGHTSKTLGEGVSTWDVAVTLAENAIEEYRTNNAVAPEDSKDPAK